MTIDDVVQYVILGIITGIFASFAPVLFGYAIEVIYKLFYKSIR